MRLIEDEAVAEDSTTDYDEANDSPGSLDDFLVGDDEIVDFFSSAEDEDDDEDDAEARALFGMRSPRASPRKRATSPTAILIKPMRRLRRAQRDSDEDDEGHAVDGLAQWREGEDDTSSASSAPTRVGKPKFHARLFMVTDWNKCGGERISH